MGTAEDLTGGLGSKVCKTRWLFISLTFLHNLGCTKRMSMTKLPYCKHFKGQEWGNTITCAEWPCHLGSVPQRYLLSSLSPPTLHTRTAKLWWDSSRTWDRFTSYPPEARDKAAEEEESISLDKGGEEREGSIDCKWQDEAFLSSQFISEAAQHDSPHHHS